MEEGLSGALLIFALQTLKDSKIFVDLIILHSTIINVARESHRLIRNSYMKQFLTILFTVGLLGLSGCSQPTPEERAAAQAKAQAYAQEQAKMRKALLLKQEKAREVALLEQKRSFEKICSSYGFKYNTSKMAECVATETRQSRQAALQASQAAEDRRQRTIQAASSAFQSYADNFVAAENKRIEQFNSRQSTTSCNTFGSNINCVSR